MSRDSVSILVLEDFDMNRSRNSDYVTSHLAAEHIAASLPTLQARMLRAFAVERTANEAAEYCFEVYGEKTKESYRKRCHELVQAGHIVPRGKRKCVDSGRYARVFSLALSADRKQGTLFVMDADANTND